LPQDITLHVFRVEKFIKPFIELIEKYFDYKKHIFIGVAPHPTLSIEEKFNIVIFNHQRSKFSMLLVLLKYLYTSKKIILHGLFDKNLVLILALNPWLLKKCYWLIWGGDFYFPEQQSWIKKQVIKRIRYLVTGATGDYLLIKEWYNAEGQHIKSFNYPSNIYKDHKKILKRDKCVYIQVGNSADPSNNHRTVFKQLLKFKHADIRIFVPLSYGNKEYAKRVIEEGKMLFGDKFTPITRFIPLEEYLEYLFNIDIAIFAHNRQQAMGNITTLLGYGKKVYLSKNSTLNGVFEEFKIKVYDADNIDLQLLDKAVKDQNMRMIKQKFSKRSLINSLKQFLS
jgi:dTDP-N-acetylfucosamine:lipid II N-acetylfucosaminyltransferase